MKLFTLLGLGAALSFSTMAQNYNVTFQVDMTQYTGTIGVSADVNGTWNGWCGNCNQMTDANMDGIWETTLPIAAGQHEFKFTVDGWTDQENFVGGEPCTVTNGGFTNRSLNITGDTTLPVQCFNACGPCGPQLDPIDLPITWDDPANNYTVTDFGLNQSMVVADPTNSSNMVLQTTKPLGAEFWAGTTLSTPAGLATAIPFTTTDNVIQVKVWSPDANIPVRLKAEDASDPTKSVETEVMTTVAADWEILTFDFTNEVSGTAAINYTYTYNMLSIFYNFGTDGNTAGEKTYYTDDVAFGMISTDNMVTFRVDMNDFGGAFTIPEVNGEFNGWCGNCTPMTDADMDGIWEVTVPISADSIEYKFSADNWTVQENLAPGIPCTKTTGGFTNRFMYVTGDTTLPAVCWESCSECTGVPTSATVMFKVDMNEYTDSYTDVNLSGDFNGWCGDCAPMSDADGDGIYELEVTVPTDSIQWKFSVDNWSDDEDLSGVTGCTYTDGSFTNRFMIPAGDTTLPAVCWGSCDECTGGSNSIVEFPSSSVKLFPNPASEGFTLEGDWDVRKNYTATIVNVLGAVEQTVRLDAPMVYISIEDLAKGVYTLQISQDNRPVYTQRFVAAQ